MKNTSDLAKATIAYDYENQAWTEGGFYVACGHPAKMRGCYACDHAGEPVAPNAELH